MCTISEIGIINNKVAIYEYNNKFDLRLYNEITYIIFTLFVHRVVIKR